ncbi:hypothetical protein F2Q70_00029680 [Brassica cretica]|uniref:Uncharacterized protein n=1 Tax=Brassica cretica TaxID=69181 RepID=A0A8S9FP27_BRACR|nr:hypothetical protein F2Q70_00029680 [Brassica cretica]
MQRRDEADQQQVEATREKTRFSHSIDKAIRPSIDDKPPSSIDIHPKPSSTMANGADNLFMQQRTVPTHQQRVTKEFYDTSGGIDNRFQHKYRHPTRPSIDVDVPPSIDRRPEFGRRSFDLFGTRKFYLEEKDECGV